MLRIALCDDDLAFMHDLHQKIVKCCQEAGYSENVSITEFSDSVYLSRTISSGNSFDLLFVDIEMPQLNGLELAQHIRTHLPAALIIFLTSHSEFSLEGYKFGALRYIPKLDLARRLPEALTAAQAEFSKLESKFLTVRHYNDVMRIPYQEIVCVRHVLRASQIITLNLGMVKDGRGLKAIYEQLGDERFIYIDRSTFVNLDHVRQIKGSEVILRNMERLPISRQMLTKVKYTINCLWGGRIMEPFRILEWVATFVESIVILSTIAAASEKRQQDLRHYCLLVLSTVSLTVLTGFMNSISAFSFLTPLVAMCFIVLVLSYILSDGTLLVRSTTCIMAYFVVVTMGYIFCALFGLLNGWSEDTFSILITPGVPRAIFLAVDKSADIILYFLVRGVLPKICSLRRRFQLALLFICSIAYVSVQYLFSTFLYSSVTMLHSIVLISWVYIFSFLIIVVVSFILIARSEQEKQTHMLLKATNQLLTDNYQQLHTYQQNHAKQIHDFNHHLTALKGLAAMKKHEEISDYIDSLLSIAYQET